MYSRFSHRLPWRAAPVVVAVLTAACEVPMTATPTPTEARLAAAAVVSPPVSLDWQGAARAQVAANNMSALAASRLYAALSVAQARAVAAVDADAGVQGAGDGNGYGAGGRALYEARRGAVAGASVRVLSWFSVAASAAHEQRLVEQGEAGPGGVHPQFTRGVAVGRAIGDAMVTRLTNDNFTRPWVAPNPLPSGAGIWTPAALPPAGGTLGQATPWFLTSNSQFRSAPPPAYLSPAFNTDLAVVVSTTTNLTPAQLAIALGWAYGANTMTPGGHWDELAAEYIAAAGMDEAQATEVFAMMNAAVYDALIACFEAKYFYWTLRPHQADPAVVRAFTVPNYPSYPSGHQSLSASAARVLAHYFPARAAAIDALRDEASISRVYAGIHYPFDMSAARTLGEAVADFAISRGLP